MKQLWQKQGLIYSERAQIPTILEKDPSTWRIFFADRTKDNKSYIRYLDVEAGDPQKIKYESKTSLLDFGPPGSFDHSGLMPSWITKEGLNVDLYYIGWSVRKDVPYQNLIGLATSKDGGDTFTKISSGPALSTSATEPYFCSTPCLVQRPNTEHLFYLSCIGWWQVNPEEPLEARYLIKHRERNIHSKEWSKDPDLTVNLKNPDEGGICRPSVITEKGRWHMWYCYRDLVGYRNNKAKSYRIGYATPDSGLWSEWNRKDSDCVLELSEAGWDSQQLCYPYVIRFKDQYFMFYNGNGFGLSGIGFATLPVSAL